MRVYMLKDVEKIGFAGQIVKVSDGYANNFLIPKKFAVQATEAEVELSQKKAVQTKVNVEALSSKAAMLAEKIKHLHLVLRERIHDKDKLYGSISAEQVVDLLKAKDIIVNKKQVEFEKSIKTTGEHKVTIKLSSKLKPEFILKVISE